MTEDLASVKLAIELSLKTMGFGDTPLEGQPLLHRFSSVLLDALRSLRWRRE